MTGRAPAAATSAPENPDLVAAIADRQAAIAEREA